MGMQQKRLLELEERAASEKEVMANAVSALASQWKTSMNAASFLSATSGQEQPILNLHMQESSDAADRDAMAKSGLMQQKKLLELEERAASEKEFMANAVSSTVKAFTNVVDRA